MRRIGLILLAAGGSTRMQTPKQLLRWGEGTLLTHSVKTALKTPCRPLIVVLGCEANSCRQALKLFPVTTVTNDEWQTGMGSSVSVGIAALEAAEPNISGALLMLVDQPMVTQELLELLIARWDPANFPIAATSYGERGGVPALFDRHFFPELRQLNSDRGAREIIAREMSRTAFVLPRGAQVDLDTLEEYRSALPK